METYKIKIELTEDEFNAVHGALVASVMACVKNNDFELGGLLSRVGLKLHAAKDAAVNKQD